MTRTADRAALNDLLRRPATAALLRDWPSSPRGRRRTVAAELEEFGRVVLRSLWYEPALSLRAVDHVRRAVSGGLAPSERAMLRRLHAHALRSVGRMDEAAAEYRYARERYEELGLQREAAVTAIGEVFALGSLGRARDAEALCRTSMRQLPADDRLSRGRIQINLATAFYHTARLQKARRYFSRALKLGEEMRDPAIVGAALHHLGLIALRKGEPLRAKRQLEKAEPLLRRSSMGVGVMYCRTVQAIAELALGNWERGLKACAELRQDFAKIGEGRAEGLVRREFAAGLLSVGALEAAHEEAARAMKKLEGQGTGFEEAQLACLLGRICVMRGLLQDAQAFLQRARNILDVRANPWVYHRCGMELARVYVATGQTASAKKLLRSASRFLQQMDPQGDGVLCLAVQAEAELSEGSERRARESARTAYRRANAYPARLYRPRIALLIAESEGRVGNDRTAVRWARRAIDDLESLLQRFGSAHLRESLVGSRDHLYEQAASIVSKHAARRREAILLELFARARSSTILEQLEQVSSRGPMNQKLRTAISQLRDDLLLHPESVDEKLRRKGVRAEIRRISAALDRSITSSSKRIERLRNAQDPERWQATLGDRTLVLFDQVQGRWVAHLLRADEGVRRVELLHLDGALRSEWRPLALALHTAAHMDLDRRTEFLDRTFDDCRTRLDRLRDAIWDQLPISEGDVILSPHGQLHDLPLEALAPARLGRVSRIAHPSRIRRRERRGTKRGSALLLHGASEGTRREARRLARQLRSFSVDVEVSASRGAVRARSEPVSVLHVAAHSVSHRQSWLLSGLELKDGWMGMESIDRRLLRGGLLYLSSCDSGLSHRTPGAGLEGWLTAGIAAGARELLLTLWKLDDETAVRFATHFYGEWCQGKSAAHAAASARSALREEHPHPFQWAGFVAVD